MITTVPSVDDPRLESRPIETLIQRLRRLGVRLAVEGGQLRVKAPRGAVDAELRGELAARKGELLAFLAQAERASSRRRPPLLARPRGPEPQPFPLSFAQQRLWFLDRLEPGLPIYNAPTAWRLRGEGPALDLTALDRALAAVVERHEVLRSRFIEIDDEPRQLADVDLAARTLLPRVDLRALAAADRESVAARLAGELARRPFDLARGPLLRALLLSLEPGDAVLVICLHHAVSDGWSGAVLQRELFTLYDARCRDEVARRGDEAVLPPLAVQYADFACWQREWLQGEELERLLAFWRRRLDGARRLELPADHPRPAERRYRGGRWSNALPEPLSRQIVTLAQQHGATLNMVLQAVFMILLGRLAGSRDVLIGSPIAGRGDSRLESLIGFFVNTLVLRGELDDALTFGDFLAQIKERTLEADAHQDLPFDALVEHLDPPREPGRQPFFDVVFAFQAPPTRDPRRRDLEIAPYGIAMRTTRFDLEFHGWLEEGRIRVLLLFDRDLFEGTTMARWGGHLSTLLHGIARQPTTRLGELDLLSAAERAQLLGEWNDTAAARTRPETLEALFFAQAEATPAAIAVETGSDRNGGTLQLSTLQLSYGALQQAVRDLAARLDGWPAETCFALGFERSAEGVIAQLAVLAAGGTYLPLDAAAPEARLRAIMDDAGCRVLLADDAFAARLAPSPGVTRIPLAAGAPSPRPRPTGAVREPQSLAYIMVTSGSTGRPKGIAVPDRAVIRLVRETGYLRFGPQETTLHVAPPSFDAATLEIWAPLLNGGRLVIHPPGLSALEDLGRFVERRRVSLAFFTAGLFRQLVETCAPRLATISQLMAGGDVVAPADVAALFDASPANALRAGSAFLNGYGPTENTTFSAVHRRLGKPPLDRPLPIGRPIGHSRAYVLDRALRPLPIGAPGELYLAGDGLARGYRRLPARTAEAFVPDPFGEPGGRLYRSGDLARWLDDGEIEFRGRRDDGQIKVRGFRIELGEIERQLELSSAVAQAAVVVCGSDERKTLVAFVVPADDTGADDTALDLTRLRRELARQLPDYMLPGRFEVRAALPLTANGKVDRRALRSAAENTATVDPGQDLDGGGGAVEDPRVELLRRIWSEVLEVESVSGHGDFFELGGHSLLATRAISRIRRTFGVELPLRALFDAPTPASLARLLTAQPTSVALEPAPRHGELPLSFAQQRLWFLDRMMPGRSFYNVPLAWELRGGLDEAALRQALSALVARHEPLRTTFPGVQGRPRQKISERPELAWSVVDLEAVDRAADRARGLAHAEAERPFDLARGPLLRVVLLRLGRGPDGEREHLLVLTVHHIVADGWSLGVLGRELRRLYAAYRTGTSAGLPPLELQYADFARWQREVLQQTLTEQLAFWRRTLDGAPTLELPTDRPRRPVQRYRGSSLPLRLGAERSAAVRRLARQQGATLFMVLLAAFKALLARLAGQEDLVLGTVIANRQRSEVEGLIGFFVNSLALRSRPRAGLSFGAFAERVKQLTLDAFAHQDLPFEKLVEELQPRRDLSRNPLFQVLFSLQNAPQERLTMAELEVRPLAFPTRTTWFDLELQIWDGEDGLEGSLSFDVDLFDPTTIARLGRSFLQLLDAASAHPAARLGELDLLAAAERHQLQHEWNDSARAADRTATLPALFAASAARNPDAPALVAEVEMCYRELQQRVERAARGLKQRGIGPESRVALLLERSSQMVIAVLAVLEAGGAYVPLDPAYPPARLGYMLRDSGATLLIRDREREALVGELESTLGAVATSRLESVDLETLSREDVGAAAALPKPGPRPQNLAYTIYTSGSTGEPRGVGVSHRNAVNFLASMAERPGIEAQDTVLALTTLSFDIALLELFLPLLGGGRLVLVDRPTAADGEALAALVERTAASTRGRLLMQATPATWRLLLAASWRGEKRLVALCGGEALAPELARQLVERCAELWNLYGPTETTVWSSRARIGDDPGVTLGRPIANTSLQILDRQLEPVPLGAAGELWIGGAGLARGYLGRPARTALGFRPDPRARHGERLYRSGDLARLAADGRLLYLGRADHQIKIRGFRLEPGEIEAALLAQPGVRAAAVVVQTIGGDPRLTAFVVSESREDVVDAWRRALKDQLPAHAIPGRFSRLDALPLTPNGKVDRRALAERPAAPEATPARAPQNAAEEAVAAVWQQVLAVESIGVEDTFFDLGGHSLLLIEVLHQLRQRFERPLTVLDLFTHSTVRSLAAFLSGEGAEQARTRSGERLDARRRQRSARDRRARRWRARAEGET